MRIRGERICIACEFRGDVFTDDWEWCEREMFVLSKINDSVSGEGLCCLNAFLIPRCGEVRLGGDQSS